METANPYERRKAAVAMPIDKDHAIRFLAREWGGQDLTQEQWEEVCPRIVRMLAECELGEGNSVGPDERLRTFDEAMAALQSKVDITGKDNKERSNLNLRELDEKHLSALEWALRNLMTDEKVLEHRIKKIIGAALTCLIQKEVVGQLEGTVGVTMIKFPKKAANKILTECMKAYRKLDMVSRWDLEGFEEGENNLWKVMEGRNYLACCAMIDMQVDPWLEKANQNLQKLGLAKLEGLPLGEADILSRSSLLAPPSEGGGTELSRYIHAITSKFPKAMNNDEGIYCDVGFATVGGKVSAKLAPVMFASVQSVKGGCTWQLIGSEYVSVWLTVGTIVATPLPADVGLKLLQAFWKCDEDVKEPFLLSTDQKGEMNRCKKSKRQKLRDPCQIPNTDEEGEEY